MSFDKASYEEKLKNMKDTVEGNTCLKTRYEAFKAERKAESLSKKIGSNPNRVEKNPILHNPKDPKTALYDSIFPIMQSQSFTAMMEQVDDQELADSFIDNMSLFAMLQWNLQTPSRENHGLCKIMAPEDYDNLLKSYDTLLKQTARIGEQFTEKQSNTVVPKKGCEKFASLITGIHNQLARDYGPVRDAAEKKEPVPLQEALEHVRSVRVSGNTASSRTMSGMQSTRKIITIVDSNGNEKTGFFTPLSKMEAENLQLAKNTAEGIAIADLAMKKGSRVDNRNSAMTKMAEMLGRGDLLAHSEEMTIDSEITKDNPTGVGTFMEAASGTDKKRLLPDDPYFEVQVNDPDNDIYTDRAKTDMMDISIVDYLCANVDRTGFNLIYNYKKDPSDGKMRLDSLKGIDNDCAFAGKTLSPAEPTNRLAALNETICISEGMARKLKEMTPESMRREMARFGFSREELSCMDERLRNLQDAVEEGKKFQDAHLKSDEAWHNFLSDGLSFMTNKAGNPSQRKACLVTVPDEKVKLLRVDALAKLTLKHETVSSGVFNNVSQQHSNLVQGLDRKEAERRQQARTAQLNGSTILKQGVADLKSITKTAKTNADAFLTECAGRTSRFRGTSPEFEKIAATLRSISQMTEQMGQKGYKPGNNDANLLSELHQRLQKNCTEYLAHKTAERQKGKSLSQYALNRMELVNRIQQHAALTRTEVQLAWNDELSRENIRMARSADVIRNLTQQMKPLTDCLKAEKTSGSSPTDRTAAQNELKEQLPDLCRKLKNFSDNAEKLPGVREAVGVCAKRLDEGIRKLGGDQVCGIDKETRSLLDSCNPDAPSRTPKSKDSISVEINTARDVNQL